MARRENGWSDDMPIIVRSFSEEDKLEIALIENIQRENLNPMELPLLIKRSWNVLT